MSDWTVAPTLGFGCNGHKNSRSGYSAASDEITATSILERLPEFFSPVSRHEDQAAARCNVDRQLDLPRCDRVKRIDDRIARDENFLWIDPFTQQVLARRNGWRKMQ